MAYYNNEKSKKYFITFLYFFIYKYTLKIILHIIELKSYEKKIGLMNKGE
jgi:hypothetical protein